MSQPLLFRFGFLRSKTRDALAVVVFLLDRIIVADLKTTRQERNAFREAAALLAGLPGLQMPGGGAPSPEDFTDELSRQADLISYHGLSDGLMVRLSREAIAWLEEHLSPGDREQILEAATEVALSDERLHKRELMILYDLALASIVGFHQLKSWFINFYNSCIARYAAQHPVVQVLQEISGITDMPVAGARLTLMQRPDEVREILIPPLSLTYDEFADWITTVSLIRASQHRRAPMNQTRIVYNTGDIMVQKGLIRWSDVSGPEDEQLSEAHHAVRRWAQAVRDGQGSIPFPDGQVFSVVAFGSNGDSFQDCCLPDHQRPGQWYITCVKQTESIEVHAVDLTGEPHRIFWCPEMADELSRTIGIPQQLADGRYPLDAEDRRRLLAAARHHF